MLSGEAAQSVFDGDYDEIELRQEWLEENTLMSGMKANSSSSPRWTPKRDRRRPTSGTSANQL